MCGTKIGHVVGGVEGGLHVHACNVPPELTFLRYTKVLEAHAAVVHVIVDDKQAWTSTRAAFVEEGRGAVERNLSGFLPSFGAETRVSSLLMGQLIVDTVDAHNETWLSGVGSPK